MLDNPKRFLKVFLCHASGDKPEVQKLYSRLISDGIDAWLDKEKLIPGQNWQVEIPKVVKNSDVVIVCLSSQSVNKEGFVQKEIKIALDTADEKPEGTIFIIPARLENCNVPERISQFHWFDLFSNNGYEWLLKALQIRADNVGAILGKEYFKETVQESIIPKIQANEATTSTSNLPIISKSQILIESNSNYWTPEFYKSSSRIKIEGRGYLRLFNNFLQFQSKSKSFLIPFEAIASIEVEALPLNINYASIKVTYFLEQKRNVIHFYPTYSLLSSPRQINKLLRDWVSIFEINPELSLKLQPPLQIPPQPTMLREVFHFISLIYIFIVFLGVFVIAVILVQSLF
jgi:hypothetical protein